MPYSPIANGLGCHVFLQCHLQYSTASGFSVSYIRNFLSGNLGTKALCRICCRRWGDKIFRIRLPCFICIPLLSRLAQKVKQKICKWKKNNRKVPVVICWYQLPVPLRLSRATGGVGLLDYYTVSHVVIKPNQETQTRETNGEQSGGGRRDAGRRNKERVMERKRRNESSSRLFMMSCVGVDGRGSKGAACHWARRRLFKACQPASILSQRYLGC